MSTIKIVYCTETLAVKAPKNYNGPSLIIATKPSVYRMLDRLFGVTPVKTKQTPKREINLEILKQRMQHSINNLPNLRKQAKERKRK